MSTTLLEVRDLVSGRLLGIVLNIENALKLGDNLVIEEVDEQEDRGRRPYAQAV